MNEILLKEDFYFKSVIDLIPAHVYVEKNVSNMYMQKLDKISKKQNEQSKKRKHPGFAKSTSEQITSADEDVSIVQKKIKVEPLSISDLQQKLKTKIEEMKQSRVSKNNKKDHKTSKLERKRKKEKQKLKKKIQSLNSTTPISELQGLSGQVNDENFNESKSDKQKIVNSDGKIVFSKFDFGNKNKIKIPKHWKNDILTGGKKDLKALLEKANNRKEKLNKLEETNPEEAEEFKQKLSWRKAVAKAEGVKLKDNPDRIKKSIQKVKSKKNKSSRKWKEREDILNEKMVKRQAKRKENLQIRKDKKKNKKIKKRMASFKKSTPGFN